MFTVKQIIAAAVFAGLSSTAFAATIVSEIDVSVDLPAVENSEAAKVWTSLGNDLETAIAERLAGQLGENGAEIVVDINEVALATAFENAYALEDSSLVGMVDIRAPGMGNDEEYELTVTAGQAIAALDPSIDRTSLTIASEEVYRAMIDAFADNVSMKLQ